MWIRRTDGILEQMTDEHGLPIQSPNRQEMDHLARSQTDLPEISEVFLRELKTVLHLTTGNHA